MSYMLSTCSYSRTCVVGFKTREQFRSALLVTRKSWKALLNQNVDFSFKERIVSQIQNHVICAANDLKNTNELQLANVIE